MNLKNLPCARFCCSGISTSLREYLSLESCAEVNCRYFILTLQIDLGAVHHVHTINCAPFFWNGNSVLFNGSFLIVTVGLGEILKCES